MAYTIKNSDGTVLTVLPDGSIDQLTTSLTLIGRNFNAYGTYYNDNLIAQLENFASDGVQPRSPLVGQLWYNRSDGRLYIYTPANSFNPVGVSTVSPTEPTAPNIGDIWIDSTNEQLYFTSDGINFTLVGPISTTSTNSGPRNGWYADIVTKSTLSTTTVVSLYNNDKLLAIASSSTFNFNTAFNGMTGVQTGINLNTSIAGIRFVGTATAAVSADYVNTFTENYLLVTPPGGFQATSGTFNVLYGDLTVSNSTNTFIASVDNNSVYLGSSVDDKTVSLIVKNGGTQISAVVLNPSDTTKPSVRFFPAGTTSTGIAHFNADVTINGDLTVYGTSTNIETTNLVVEDKNIQLAYGQVSPSDTFADGGGITLIGTTDHSITWSNTRSAWESNDDFNLTSSTYAYKINNNTVITATSLGSVITSAPGLTTAPVLGTIGTLSILTVSNVVISGQTISTRDSGDDLILNPRSGTIDVLSNRIINVSTCTTSTEVANKSYVDGLFSSAVSRVHSLSIDITNMADPNVDIITYLDAVLPPLNPGFSEFDLPNGTRCRVLCQNVSTSIPQKNVTFTKSFVTVDKGGVQNSQSVLADTSGIVTATNVTYAVTLTVKQFSVLSGAWNYDGDII